MKQAFVDLFALKVDAFQKALKAERKENPQNKAADYLEAAYICINMYVNEDEAYFNSNEKRVEELISSISRLDSDNPYRLLYMGELHMTLALLDANYGNQISAIRLLFKANGELKENYRKFPDFVPNYVPMGTLSAAIGSLPEDYQSIAGVFGFEGDVSQGMALIKKGYWYSLASDSLRFYQNFNGFIYSYVSHQLDADEISPESLSLNFKDNIFLAYVQMLIWNENGKSAMAVKLLEDQLEQLEGITIPYLYYLLGKIALPTSPESAYKAFQKYLELHKYGNYRKSTYRYLAWYYLLKDDTKNTERYRQKVLTEGNDKLGADKQAFKEAYHGWSKPLVQGRLYFDGAMYQKALNALDGADFSKFDTNEKVEFYYRSGRCYADLGQNDKAMNCFKKALEIPDTEESYALGNSALHLGMLYEKKNDKANAKKYFKRALQIDGFPFYEGIHQKAKTGLDRLKG